MRPWRLTRRQRVEMEAALAKLRRRAWTWPLTDSLIDGLAALGERDEWATLRRFSYMDDRWSRVARARIAIALRAALRADEDARCEEAMAATSWGHGDDRFYGGADCAIDELREWPPLVVGYLPSALALWERTPRPSLWAQSPPTSDPRGPR